MSPTIEQFRSVLVDVKPDVVVWSHSYLAAIGMSVVDAKTPQIVEFANIERLRSLSFAKQGPLLSRIGHSLEYLKAITWEKRVARAADLCVVLSDRDGTTIAEHSVSVMVVRNGFDLYPVHPSPNEPNVLAVANWNYAPNRQALRSFLAQHWATVKTSVPAAVLSIVGGGSDRYFSSDADAGIQVHGFVPDLNPFYENAGLVLAPADSGGGSQLKVSEALSHSRVVVGPTYLENEIREDMPPGALRASADLGKLIPMMLNSRDERHRVERDIDAYVRQHSWEIELSKLVEAIGSTSDERLGSSSERE
jgi:hypothetical protein